MSRSERPITSTSGSSPGPTPRSEPRGFPAPNYSHLAVTKIHASVPTSVNLYSDTSAEEEWVGGGEGAGGVSPFICGPQVVREGLPESTRGKSEPVIVTSRDRRRTRTQASLLATAATNQTPVAGGEYYSNHWF